MNRKLSLVACVFQINQKTDVTVNLMDFVSDAGFSLVERHAPNAEFYQYVYPMWLQPSSTYCKRR